MALWTAAQAAAATGGEARGNWDVTGISIDTRTLQKGDLFVALKDIRDGHEFVARALKNGAGAALVSYIPEDVSPDAPLLLVRDVLPALEELARAARARTSAKVIAITGSVGKTSTKEMLRAILSPQGKTHAAEASYNNHWGVPLTLARMPADTDFAIIEIGMNHPGEIAPLAKLTQPDVAMITTVAAAHLEAFENVEAIAHEKAAIFEGLIPGGHAIINADLLTTPILQAAAKQTGAQISSFGASKDAQYRLENVRLSNAATIVEASQNGPPILFKLATPGRHFAMNALGALAVAQAAGADLAISALSLGQWAPPAGRGTVETLVMDVVEDELRFELIDDAFNANPASLEAALDVLAASTPADGIGRVAAGRRIAVLGDMLELGPDEGALHRAIATYPAIENLHTIYCVGPRMRTLHEALPEPKRGGWFEDANALSAEIHSHIDAGDIILVKGSKGSYVSQVVDAIRKLGHPLSEQMQGNE
ncbi:MAG: UDP-N-acetylmuramoyl-tripeptide--D-alanyl-D-alanine ligase [Halocynthiibacter sp.]|jgi:UDP-N-acetylmuramoyl-tripeptide--D-alanyl-D-alanine ligase